VSEPFSSTPPAPQLPARAEGGATAPAGPPDAGALLQLTHAALDSVSEGFVILDRDWRFAYINRAAERFIQKSRAELLGRSQWESFPEAGDRLFGREYRRAVAENVPVQFEEFYPEPLNAWFEVRAYPSPAGLSIFFRDITERRKTEEALRVNLTKYAVLFDSFPLGISVTDSAGLVREVNSTASRLLGAKPEAVLRQKVGTPQWRIIRPDGSLMPPEEFASVRAMTEQGVVEDVETGIARPGEDVIWVSVSAAPIPLEGYGVVITYGDISRRKRAEDDLKAAHREALAARARLEAAMEAVPVGLAILDADGGILRANAAYNAIWGPTRPSARSVADYVEYKARWLDTGRELLPEEWASARAVKSKETVVGQLMEIERFGGGRAFVLNSAAPIFGESGAITGCAVAIQDISRRVEAERALEHSQEALRAANVRLEAANVGLRQSNETLEARVAERTAELTRRAAQVQALALDRTRVEEQERQRIARVIHDHLQQLLALARINLDLALGEATTASGQKSLHALNALLADALDVTRRLTAEIGPAILYRGNLCSALRWLGRWFDTQYRLSVDVAGCESVETEEEVRVALFRAARELLFNVVKHAHVPSARIDVSRSADGRVQVVVRDDGVGFAPESVMDASGTEGSFGLLSVRDHLELLGGRLDVDSAPGCGTSITILGPAPRPPEPEAAAPSGRAGVPPQDVSQARPARPRRPKRTSKR
jgi:PAS domain S-box-containing protein